MKLGFIGCGNMAAAIMGGIISNGFLKPDEIIGADLFEGSREKVRKNYGINVTDSNLAVAENAETIILSVKPQFYHAVIDEIKDVIKMDTLIITIAPGKTLEWLHSEFGRDVKIVRTMPNTPALVLEGMTAACVNPYVTEEEKNYAVRLLESFGKVSVVPEKMIDAVVSVSGSSPAYVFMMIEAMADGAVREGMPRAMAYQFAAQAVMGSAKMVLELGKHPGELKDMVCSPGGTTIEAVRVLEEMGFRSAIMEAEAACAEVSRSL